MQFSKFLTPLLLISAFACDSPTQSEIENAQPSRIYQSILADSLELNPNQGLVLYKNQAFSGKAITKYANDSLSTSISYVNGQKEGLYRKWFADGTKSYEANYLAGKLHGKSYSWWSNGNLRSESNFLNGVPDGTQYQYYKSGEKFKKVNLVQGKEEGLQQSWRENGKLYNNYEAKNGRIFGLKRSKLCFQLDDEQIQN